LFNISVLTSETRVVCGTVRFWKICVNTYQML